MGVEFTNKTILDYIRKRKISKGWLIVNGLFLVGVFVVILLYSINRNRSKTLCYQTALDSATVWGKPNRGIISVNDSVILHSWSEVIAITKPCAIKEGAEIGDVQPPYTIWKSENNDTLFGRKGDCHFSVLLVSRCWDHRKQ